MEGNVPLGMLAVFFIETNPPAANLIAVKKNLSLKTDNARRIRRIWQLPNPGSSYTLPAGVINEASQIMYTSPDSYIGNNDGFQNEYAALTGFPGSTYKIGYSTTAAGNSGWFAGDFIPFKNCAYLVSMSSFVNGANL